MNLTNKYNLPEILVKAVEYQKDDYNPGDADISVTSLIAPAYQAKLIRENSDKLSEDVSDRVWALQGTSIHYIIQGVAERLRKVLNLFRNIIAEERFKWSFEYYDIETQSLKRRSVSAQIDLLHNGHLIDYKLTSVYSVKGAIIEGKPDWIAQVNIQRYLLERTSHEVEKQSVVAFSRDWRKNEAARDDNYPPTVVDIPIPVWTDEQVEEYISERLTEHFRPDPNPCSFEETWEKPPTFALMKVGRKSAVKVEANLDDLQKYAAAKGLYDPEAGYYAKGHYVEGRKGSRPRCEQYCAAKDICPAYTKWLGEKLDS